jgi:hypothetical protein
MAAFAQTPSSPSLADEIIDETSASVQDSSADDNTLEDNNEFGDEGAAIDQESTEEQDAANVGAQDDDVGGDITISCNPPSGSTFPMGSTEVQCTATDEAGNTGTASFMITVAFTCQGEPATIVGTPGNDDLSGTGARDVIALLEGDDRVNAGDGDDLICGDEGNDPLLVGDAGDDLMSGDAGDDNLNSVDGVMNNDRLNGDTGTDTCESDPDTELSCEL